MATTTTTAATKKTKTKNPHDLTNDELIARLRAICARSRKTDVTLIVHLIEVESRSLHLAVACSSLYDFCTRRLGMSGSASQRRIIAARLAKQFPSLLRHLASGKVHLSHVCALRDVLTASNVEELVEAVSNKTMAEVDAILAARFPRPDVPDALVDLPPSGPGMSGSAARLERLKPLSERRCLLQVSISTELRAKLERARELMRHRNPSGSLETILDAALDVLIEKVEKERLGKVAKPRLERDRPGPTKTTGRIARATRREVFARAGGQCSFVDGQDRRCPSRSFLELDHVQSRALGGSDEASNLRLLCRAHNRLHAEQVFGKRHVAAQIDNRQRQWPGAPWQEADAAFFEVPDAVYDADEAAHYARLAEKAHRTGLNRGAPS